MNDAVEKYVSELLALSAPDSPAWNMEHIRSGKQPCWNYIDGCMLRALKRLGEVKGKAEYLDFCDKFLDYYVDDEGGLLGYDSQTFNLDNICEGNALIDVYAKTKKNKYLAGIERLNRQLLQQPRTYEGNYWHKLMYPAQVWLDGMYMAQVFRVRRAALLNDFSDCDDVLKQFASVRKRMFDEKTRLYRHGYDASKTAFWADENGLSANSWLRSTGWFAAALADCASEWTRDCDGKRQMTTLLEEALAGAFAYRDDESGMFFQVIDKGDKEGNYIETSGSALIAYAALRGANSGLLCAEWKKRGSEVLEAIETRKLKKTSIGFALTDICLVAGLGPESDKKRDGSFEYYISEPVVSNEAKGVAPFLMAYAERAAGEAV